MEIKQAEFQGSYGNVAELPSQMIPEFPFLGRSNVGKSALINELTGRKHLAHTSKKPGKTRRIHYYRINDDWYLVDLPGYGYGKVPKKERNIWKGLIGDYLESRSQLVNAFLLIDPAVPPQESDRVVMDQMGAAEVPFSVVFTKTDRMKPNELDRIEAHWKAEMKKNWAFLPPFFRSSAHKKTGRKALLDHIATCLKMARE